MKTFSPKSVCCVAILFCSSIGLIGQSVPIAFTGTPGSTAVSATFSADVQFTITSAAASGDFVLFDINNLYATAPSFSADDFITSFDSNLHWSVNGGANNNIAGWAADGFSSGAANGLEGYFWISIPSGMTWNPGDIVTLHAGSLTSTTPAPANFNLGASGSYEMFIVDAGVTGMDGLQISSSGITSAVPEPSTYAAIFGVLALGFVSCLKRDRRFRFHNDCL